MKTNMINSIIRFGLVLLCCVAITSCQYDEIASADYPDELIYLPVAVNGIYVIDNLATPTLADPTSGNTFRFTVNPDSNEFNVPLAVYRSGIKGEKSIIVDITANTDTVVKLIAAGTTALENTELLPADKYSFTPSLKVDGGSDVGSFNLIIDLDFLKANAPNKKYAIGISVSSPDRKSNPIYSTAIILIDTKFIVPIPEFSFLADDVNNKIIKFMDASKYTASYAWDFGDGSTSETQNPVHTYAAIGNYSVKLSAKGVLGDVAVYTATVSITN